MIVSACRGSLIMVIAEAIRKPIASAMSSPTPGSASRTTAKPM
jgi:hypothetical protein